MKIRCDASLDYSRSCSRCLKRGVECTVLQGRRKGNSMSDISIGASPDAPQRTPLKHQADQADALAGVHPATYPDTRTINGVEVSADLIDVCFDLFNTRYHPIAPILSSMLTPDETFHESEFKFWVIVAIGSRRCTQDPTLFPAISASVEDLAINSIRLRGSPYPVIEALLLMCTWPLSSDKPFSSSIYLTISTTVLPLTLQAGLHRCWSMHAVFRERDLDVDQDGTRGARLWAYAVIIAQSAMFSSGFPVMHHSGSQHLFKGGDCCLGLPPWLLQRGRTTGVLVRGQQALSELGIENTTASNSLAITSLVSVLEFELASLQPHNDPMGDLQTSTALLFIRAMYLLAVDKTPDMIHMAKLLTSAIEMMDTVNRFDEAMLISQHCPEYLFEALVLAAAVLLKLIKGLPEAGLDRSAGKAAFFSAINIFKSISTVNNDVPGRVTAIFTDLWSSARVFKNSEGDYVCPIRVRNRLVMSVAFDCFWWYRESVSGWPNRPAIQNNPGSEVPYSEHTPQINSFTDDLFDFWNIDWATITPGVTLNSSYPDAPGL
ncbi:hypothetical protein GQ53DRAFT_202383 [Thozetella sp. PMI_491]|nr:hypothetical protein GQ53DRAFT_202383 [Thozetella sp. PMI_491]